MEWEKTHTQSRETEKRVTLLYGNVAEEKTLFPFSHSRRRRRSWRQRKTRLRHWSNSTSSHVIYIRRIISIRAYARQINNIEWRRQQKAEARKKERRWSWNTMEWSTFPLWCCWQPLTLHLLWFASFQCGLLSQLRIFPFFLRLSSAIVISNIHTQYALQLHGYTTKWKAYLFYFFASAWRKFVSLAHK